MKRLKIALIQMSMKKDPAENVAKALKMAGQAARKGAKIIFLPELFHTLYFPATEDQKNFKLAESVPGPIANKLAKFARSKKIAIVAGIFEKRTHGLYHNSAVTIDTNGKIAKYRKMHIPDDPGFYEKYYFAPGDLGFQSVKTKYAKIGTLICWDQWYPEGARLTALKGAQILAYPTAIGWGDFEKPETRKSQHEAWEIIQRSHAVANGVFVVSINRVGKEKMREKGATTFWGQSFVCDPYGQILVRGSASKEEILTAEIDFSKIDDMRENWPFLRDRRVDAYMGITERFLE